MKLSDFQSAVQGEIRFSDFLLKIRDEVDAYGSFFSSREKGITIPIYLEEDLDELVLTTNNIKKICFSFLNNEIDKHELSYLADALTLSENIIYDNEKSKEAIYSFADPEINGEITSESVQKTIKAL